MQQQKLAITGPVASFSLVELLTAEGLKLGLEHYSLPCLAALSITTKCWRARVQAALNSAARAAAQQLLLQLAGGER
jgi:hypothetical protein